MSLKKVRILASFTLDGREYAPNRVVQVEDAKVKQAIKDGVVDPSKAAVDYCLEELGAQVIVHDVAEKDAPPPAAPPAAPDDGQSDLQV